MNSHFIFETTHVVVIASPSQDGGRRPRRPRRDTCQRYNLYRSQPPGEGGGRSLSYHRCY